MNLQPPATAAPPRRAPARESRGRSLYISNMGMLEPLGQSQVLPYLEGLADRGYSVEILAFERAGADRVALAELHRRLSSRGMLYQPMFRSAEHSLPVKVWESSLAVLRGLAAALRRRPQIVHARSHLPAAVADMIATLSPGAKMLFDCRGMLGDEYVEAGYWTKDRLEYRLLKRWERRAFARSEGLVVLTHALAAWLKDQRLVGERTRVEVIPCCVDLDRFRPDPQVRARMRAELGLGERLVVVYSGSLGGWYHEEAMGRFVGHVKRLAPDAAFLVLSHYDCAKLRASALKAGLTERDFVLRAVPSKDMPAHLSAGDLGVSLIEKCFSKLGSSPTKVAEYLGSGMPVLVNAGVGDQAELRAHPSACVVTGDVDDESLARAAREAVALAQRPFEKRVLETARVARSEFALEDVGVARYADLYGALCDRRPM